MILHETYTLQDRFADNGLKRSVEAAHAKLQTYGGMTGWRELPAQSEELIQQIQQAAEQIRRQSTLLVVVGIGGSDLGCRAVSELMEHRLNGVKLAYLGGSLDAVSAKRTLALCQQHEVSTCIVSKSGGTMEPAVGTKLILDYLQQRYPNTWQSRVYAVTDGQKGKLRALCQKHGFVSFTVPENVGGRYSVLSPVGLLPLAAAGADIRALLKGAEKEQALCETLDWENNGALRYAYLRNLYLRAGRNVEMLCGFAPYTASLGLWWRQLFGESEGKNGLGIFPSTAVYTADLHSMGQFVQQSGGRLFETFLVPALDEEVLAVPAFEDGNDYLDGTELSALCRIASHATADAHNDGGVPVITLEPKDFSEEGIGELIQFFLNACAISALTLGVEPFDQPGVEAYKKNIRDMLAE
ncbi:MAG: glucose-6-phosphate isomerase [Clostridia bacterium]|nr:glucose-6-phosphate isomerase [Clostridia bacterium]